MDLSTPVKYVKRIGDRVAAGLAERGVHTIEDLLYHLPFRYEDRLHPKPLADYNPGDMASLVGEVRGTVLLRTRSAPIFEMTVGIQPPTGPGAPGVASETSDAGMANLLKPPPVLETVKCLWFHGTYLKDRFKPGQRVALYGKLEASRSGNALNAARGLTKFKMVQPIFEILPDANTTGDDAEFTMLEMGRIVPVYESLGGKTPWGAKLTSRWLRRVMWTVFRDLAETRDKSGATADETLPAALRERLGFPTRMAALEALHFPAEGVSLDELAAARTPAHRRLIFEELWYLELGLELKRQRLRDRPGTAFVTDDRVRAALKQVLPFKPTAAQKRVLSDIVTDMREPRPMRRLLQGDVGSGKTIVAFQAALVAIENGYQVAMMAPTEILATQHFLAAKKLLANAISPRTGQHYRVHLLTGSLDDRSKRDARARIYDGRTDFAIGTHALVEDKVDFANLGLVIVDEQHRFGVQQRFQLTRKSGAEPDVLVMTATPIPRTLALTLYGDLEVSVIDELPPGRSPIVTRRVPPDRAAEVWQFVRKQVAAKRQAYLVYPIIEGDRTDQPDLDFAEPESATDAAADPPVDADTSRFVANIEAMLAPYDGYGAADAVLKPRSTRIAKSLSARSSPNLSSFAAPSNLSSFRAPSPNLSSFRAPSPNLSSSAAPSNLSSFRAAGGSASHAATRPSAGTEGAGAFRPLKPSSQKQGASAPGPPRAKPKLRSATEMFDDLRSGALAGLRLGLLHGRMSADDKEVTMARFKRGEIDVLLATTVIEVGVDVPNATVMVIDHAERFGLAQLHQLRGRVGRGAARSSCLLLTGDAITPEAELRLDAMIRTQNGFELAELDLQQRGPGEFFGTRQAGLPDFRVASLTRDRDILELAKLEAARFARTPDPTHTRTEIEAVWSRLKQQWQRRYGLVEA